MLGQARQGPSRDCRRKTHNRTREGQCNAACRANRVQSSGLYFCHHKGHEGHEVDQASCPSCSSWWLLCRHCSFVSCELIGASRSNTKIEIDALYKVQRRAMVLKYDRGRPSMMRRNALRANCKLGQICRPPYFIANLTGRRVVFKDVFEWTGNGMKSVLAPSARPIKPFGHSGTPPAAAGKLRAFPSESSGRGEYCILRPSD